MAGEKKAIGSCRLGAFVLSFWLLLPILAIGQSGVGASTATLKSAQSNALQLFQSGQYKEAEEAFEYLVSQFGAEPEMQTREARMFVGGVRAYLAFLLGDNASAIQRFRAYLTDFPEKNPQHAFAQYTLAQALELDEQLEEAAQAYLEFSEAYSELPEANVALLRRIDLLFRAGQKENATLAARKFSGQSGPISMRQQSLLRVLREMIDSGEFDEARVVLAETPWRIDSMPELAVLAFAALQIGDYLLGQSRFSEALHAYRFVPPLDKLVIKQEAAIAAARARLEAQRGGRSGSSLDGAWVGYFEQTIARMEAQLASLQKSEDYTPGYFLRFGTAFLGSNRNYEAWIVFRNLSIDERVSSKIREEAHYRWILAAFQMERWQEALGIAREFQDRFPDSPLAPDALYLVARTYQEDRRYRSAVEVLDDLLERFPENRLASRWLYTRGYNRSMMEDYPGAREDFGAFLVKYSDSPLVFQARLWSALTHDFEKDYALALEALNRLREDLPENHPIEPEVTYRIASSLYGAADYREAERALTAYMRKYPGHLRIPEAQVLLGDVLMGLGELERAVEEFAKVTIEAAGLFPYAIFQRGKIFQALEDYDGMIDHFSSYLERSDLPINARLSEALYWIGWAWDQKGEPTRAAPLWEDALNRFGNDTSAREISSILSALEQLKKSIGDSSNPIAGTTPFTQRLLAAPTFRDWLVEEAKLALREGKPTYHSRLRLKEAEFFERRKNFDAVNTVLLEIDEVVPLRALDPEAAGRIGLIYLAAGFDSARKYFEYLIEDFERHPARAYGLRGLGELALREEKLEDAEALFLRLNRELPNHPIALEGRLLLGTTLTQLGDFKAAEEQFNSVLELKHARGERHAEAMRGLAEMNQAAGRPERAIPYWQKIYNMYRAFPERMAEAYVRSAILFEEIGDSLAAYRTVQEMLRNDRLAVLDIASEARAIRDRLALIHPDEDRGETSSSVGNIEPVETLL
ncbi:MAG: tetratricopeptide repeat protein [Puniceicoccaceae bacterium]